MSRTFYGNYVVTAIDNCGGELEHYNSFPSLEEAQTGLAAAVKANWNGHKYYKITEYLGLYAEPEDDFSSLLPGYEAC